MNPTISPNMVPEPAKKEPLPLTNGHALLSGAFKGGIVVALQIGCTATGWALWAMGAPMSVVYAGAIVYALLSLPLPAFVAYGDFDSVPRDLGIKKIIPIFLFGMGLLWFSAALVPFAIFLALFSKRKRHMTARQQMRWVADKASQLVQC